MHIKQKIFIGLLILPLTIFTEEPLELNQLEDEISLALDLKEPVKVEPTIPFSFKAEPISNVVKLLAAYKKINIIEPATDAYRKLTVTFSTQENIPLDDAWNLLQTFLKLGGYALALRGEQYSIVQRTDQAGRVIFQKEVLPLYINVEPEELPFTDAPIRAMFFLENLALSPPTATGTPPADDPIGSILNDMLSQGAGKVFDPDTKTIVLTDSANLISSAMKIVYALDRGGIRETVEIVPLYNTSAGFVGKFLREGLGITGATDQPQTYLTRTQRAEGHPYFSPNTSIVSDDRSNSLILLGREANVDRLKQFIEEYIDVPPDKGESILHSYDLQHLDSQETATILNEVLAGPVAVPETGQKEQAAILTGPERYFQNPVILAESYTVVATAETIGKGPSDLTGYQQVLTGDITQFRPYTGGNRLIVAALSHDWQRIEELLRKIDQPTQQVIIEVLVVDCSFTDDRFLRGAIRNPKAIGLQEGQSFQNQNLPGAPSDALVYDVIDETTQLTGDLSVDLLKELAQAPGETLASLATQGTLMISFKDPMKSGIWGLIEVFQNNEDFKILQHPSVVTATNTTATIAFSNNRRARGSVGYGAGGALTVPIVNFTAQLAISITPRTSSAHRVNLTVAIENSNFTNDNSGSVAFFDTRKRAIGTNINISNNQAVALGGLMNSETETSETQVPFISRIPFFGNFFRGTAKQERKTNLVFFISARVVKPRGTTHTREYTSDKLARGIYHLDDYDLFSALQDPVTRFFFRKNYDEKHLINDYMLETQGKMLDPDTYTHDICNDEKVANKFSDPQIPKPGDPPPFNRSHEDVSTTTLEPAAATTEIADTPKTNTLKEQLADTTNPLTENAQIRHHTDFELSRSLDHINDYREFSTRHDPIAGTFLRKKYDEKHLVNDYMLETRGEMLPPDLYLHEPCNDEKLAHKFADQQIPSGRIGHAVAPAPIDPLQEDVSNIAVEKEDISSTRVATREDVGEGKITDFAAETEEIAKVPAQEIMDPISSQDDYVDAGLEETSQPEFEREFAGTISLEDEASVEEGTLFEPTFDDYAAVAEDIPNNETVLDTAANPVRTQSSDLKEILIGETNPLQK